ncbi:hypothetical protein HO133_009477 [Letharia lupina]|uniref:Alpha/beta hydrolase fold-3 domain-containing protein n=1 Tax=Letharia lupina TaxID=560253 RepID=A0A8H6CLA3_9LECA|nr:uncharacterized protein HO133_009477 [Letharia lupina]KAF6225477.1 hypothetical protein HO133_009477 [Letharia lupina]
MSTQIRPVPSNEGPSKTIPIPANHQRKPHPRWWLSAQANVWRFLGQVGLYFHSIPTPSPKEPSFLRKFPTTVVSGQATMLHLAFYVPDGYQSQIQQGRKYPLVVNMHGGGFTLGTAKDDGRWATMVVKQVEAVFVSVEYRLAPEYPFPTAVEDGVEALLHLAANADELGLNPHKMALTGFSAGGNMAFTMPLRLRTHIQSTRNEYQSKPMEASQSNGTDRTLSGPPLPEIVSIIAWYPSLDNRLTRDERRASCVRPGKTLPPILTSLFDESYLPELENRMSPYASPAAATDADLTAAIPEGVAMYLCEWDMLLQEGEVFAERLKGLGKRVHLVIIKEKRHGFDKSPYPFSVDPEATLHYTEACTILKDALFDS